MKWIVRLSGILVAAYLVYFAALLSENSATASDGPVMAMAISGEMMPAMDAVEFNNLHAYKERYPAFPAILNDTRWVHTLDRTDACASKPQKVWTFSGGEFGRLCTLTGSKDTMTYSCESTGFMGHKTVQNYSVKFGDPILPDWALDRPHVTLVRKGLRKKTIGLRMCEA